MNFAHPGYLWLFLLFIPLIAWWVWKERKGNASLRLSTTRAFDKLPTSWRVYLRHLSFALKLATLGCLIVILCRPQIYDRWSTSDTEGTDIVIALDISGSMYAKDFTPDRFHAAKKVAADFVAQRENDNVGLVVFAGEGFTQVPMTTDKAIVVNAIQDLEIGMLEDGTAIGDGIATAINRIKSGRAKSKSIILLTDGTNNAGVVAPLTAAEIAKADSIRIYTIGVGTTGTAPMPVGQDWAGNLQYQNMPVTIDEPTLKQIAAMTGGKYFRATGNGMLEKVFKEIDSLEKTKIDVKKYSNTQDNYMPWAWLLLLLVGLDVLLGYTLLRRFP